MNPEVKRLHDEALALIPPGATHDRTLCPVCRVQDVAATEGTPSGSGRPDGSATTGNDATGGRDKTPMSDISKETHEQLLASAVAQVKAEKDAEIAKLTSERDTANSKVEELTKERDEQAAQVTKLTEENTRLNGELDTAQVSLKTATDKVGELEQEVAKRDQAAELAEIASKRIEQVKNLKLFTDEHAEKRGSEWAALSEEDWAARLEDYKALRGDVSASGDGKVTDDTASALSGAGSERGADEQAAANQDEAKMSDGRKASRSILGLVAN